MKRSKSHFIAKLNQAAPLLTAIASEKSFSKAAEKLGVHQSAVSHRIHLLEETLDLPLFERTTRQVTLTEYGEIFCAAAFDALACWENAFNKLEKFRTQDTIRLSVSSALAMKWVLPHLSSAQETGLDISLDVDDRLVDFNSTQVDVAIRFGPGPYPGLHATFLKEAQVVPVASPNYCPEDVLIEHLAQLPTTTFLKDAVGEKDQTDFSWDYYLAKQNIPSARDHQALTFKRADLALQAAINGMGVGLGRTLLVEGDVEQGFLKIIGPKVAMDSGYWLVCKPSFAMTQRFDQLKLWLSNQMKSS